MTADPVTESALLSAALWYAEKGLAVFPLHAPTDVLPCDCGHADCTNHGKHPWTTHGLLEATTNESTIREWWQRWPRANIGIRTGSDSGIIVVDVDPRHDGYSTLGRLFAQYGAFPATREAKTGGGGGHFYFRSPPGVLISSGNGALGPGVDLKGEGGYVVAPPSLHESRERYEWAHPAEDGTTAELPTWIVHARESARESGTNGKEHIRMEDVLSGVPHGQRDSTLFRAASKLRYAGVPLEWAERLISDAARKCIPPFPEREAIAKVASAYGRYEPGLAEIDDQGEAIQIIAPDAVRVLTVCPLGPVELIFSNMEKAGRELDAEMSIRLLLPGTAPEPYRQRINMLSASARDGCRRELDAVFGKDGGWTKLLSQMFTKAQDAFLLQDRAVHTPDIAVAATGGIEYVVEGFAPAEGPTILFGAGGGGKTYLTYLAAICIANGVTFLGRQTQRRRVLVIDYETGEATYGMRMRRLLAGLDDPSISASGIYFWDANGIPLHDQIDAIRRTNEKHGIGMILMDHAGAACGTEPEKAEAALRTQRDLRRIGLPSLLIAHITGDSERDPTQVLRPFGSIFWRNMARQTWFVQRAPKGDDPDKAELGLIPRKENDSGTPPAFGVNVFFGQDGGPVRMAISDIRRNPVLSESRGVHWKIWNVLHDHVRPMKAGDIGKELKMLTSTVRKEMKAHNQMFTEIEDDLWQITDTIIQGPWS